MTIRKRGNKYILYDSKGRKKGEHSTRKSAEKQETKINIEKARAKGHKIPKPRKKRK